ncbi:Sec-independent protein translocase protein TatCy [Polystyrenella longa]|uniref:Sec-independent protein translocase protein TatC n=1 Tax=Polystyrenella longa TaxID=2528007 RepID=A0A518CRD4_9PLAN|nr:twin-arginine translocase subunit TatC [Polystyrenella longa]QDU81778.1 Sec-independent protein translocase protein TatCy [Polystyrenella longa]
MAKSRDLFEESSMSFGEHLEILRVHLIRGLIGLVLACCVTLFYGQELVQYITQPIKEALLDYNDYGVEKFDSGDEEPEIQVAPAEETATNESADPVVADEQSVEPDSSAEEAPEQPEHEDVLKVKVRVADLVPALHEVDPEQFPKASVQSDKEIVLPLKSDLFKELYTLRSQQKALVKIIKKNSEPVTREVHEAFLIYLKVSIVAGLVLSSPWLIYQLWLFVAAGLYPSERRYVYYYLPFSIGLFLTGVMFCFYLVLPFVLSFLLSFNKSMGVDPQIFLKEWISFAIMLPVMFGVSFQLPVVMLFMERLSICSVETYREKRRMAILVIAVVSMLMTPSDPQSMILMMVPLLFLYELGIVICQFNVNKEAKTETI